MSPVRNVTYVSGRSQARHVRAFLLVVAKAKGLVRRRRVSSDHQSTWSKRMPATELGLWMHPRRWVEPAFAAIGFSVFERRVVQIRGH